MTSPRAVCLLLALLVVSGAQAGVLRVPLRKLPLTRLSSSTRPYLKQLIASANAGGEAPVPLRNFLDAQVWVWPVSLTWGNHASAARPSTIAGALCHQRA